MSRIATLRSSLLSQHPGAIPGVSRLTIALLKRRCILALSYPTTRTRSVREVRRREREVLAYERGEFDHLIGW